MPDGYAAARVAAIVLAAGRGTRFEAGGGGPKMLAPVGGVAMVRRVAEAALASQAQPVLAVTGHRRDEVAGALHGLPLHEVINPQFATGLASSLKAGIAAIPGACDGVVVLLGDMPLLSSALIDTLIGAFARAPSCDAVVPTNDGHRGNPVLLSSRLFPTIASLEGDEGARRVIARSDHVVEVPVDDGAVSVDIDTREALEALLARTTTR